MFFPCMEGCVEVAEGKRGLPGKRQRQKEGRLMASRAKSHRRHKSMLLYEDWPCRQLWAAALWRSDGWLGGWGPTTTTSFPPSSINCCSPQKTNKQTKASCSLIYEALLKCWLRIRGFYRAKLCPTELHFISISKGNVINSFTGNSEWSPFRTRPIFWITEYALVCGIVLKSVCGYIYYNSFFFFFSSLHELWKGEGQLMQPHKIPVQM